MIELNPNIRTKEWDLGKPWLPYILYLRHQFIWLFSFMWILWLKPVGTQAGTRHNRCRHWKLNSRLLLSNIQLCPWTTVDPWSRWERRDSAPLRPPCHRDHSGPDPDEGGRRSPLGPGSPRDHIGPGFGGSAAAREAARSALWDSDVARRARTGTVRLSTYKACLPTWKAIGGRHSDLDLAQMF